MGLGLLDRGGGSVEIGQLAGGAQFVAAGAPLLSEGRHPLAHEVKEGSRLQQAGTPRRRCVAEALEPAVEQRPELRVLLDLEAVRPGARVQRDPLRSLAGQRERRTKA